MTSNPAEISGKSVGEIEMAYYPPFMEMDNHMAVGTEKMKTIELAR